jgi:hypothetical protein
MDKYFACNYSFKWLRYLENTLSSAKPIVEIVVPAPQRFLLHFSTVVYTIWHPNILIF